MKKFATIIATIALLTSCYSEEYITEQDRLQRPKAIYTYAVKDAIKQPAATIATALRLQEWCNVSDYNSKIAIEDKYFPNYKIRERGDTLLIIQNGGYDGDVKFIRKNSSDITKAGSSWQIDFTCQEYGPDNILEIECVDNNEWSITTKNGKYFCKATYSMTAKLSDDKSAVVLSGAGDIAVSAKRDDIKSLKYDITNIELALSAPAINNNSYYSSMLLLTYIAPTYVNSAELTFTEIKNAGTEDTHLSIEEYYATIEYKGYSEICDKSILERSDGNNPFYDPFYGNSY